MSYRMNGITGRRGPGEPSQSVDPDRGNVALDVQYIILIWNSQSRSKSCSTLVLSNMSRERNTPRQPCGDLKLGESSTLNHS
jgi:hypothetical protein